MYMNQQNPHAGYIGPGIAPVAGGYLGTGSAENKMPQSTREVAAASVHTGLTDLQYAIETLSARLAPVLQPAMPQPTNDKLSAANPAPHSPAVNELHAMRNRLEQMVSAVNDLSSRLEA